MSSLPGAGMLCQCDPLCAGDTEQSRSPWGWEGRGRAEGRCQPEEGAHRVCELVSGHSTCASHTHGLAHLQMCTSCGLTYPTGCTSHRLHIPQTARLQIHTSAASHTLLTPAGSRAPHWEHPTPQHPSWGQCQRTPACRGPPSLLTAGRSAAHLGCTTCPEWKRRWPLSCRRTCRWPLLSAAPQPARGSSLGLRAGP